MNTQIKGVIKEMIPHKLKLYLKDMMNKHYNKLMNSKKNHIFSFDKDKYSFGINLIGDIKAETGLGQSMRILAVILQKSKIPFCIYQINSPGELEQNDNSWSDKITNSIKYGINVIHINPNMWAEKYIMLQDEILNYRYNIAYWLWELEDFPNEWIPCMETVDEIWTPSEFVSNSIRKKVENKSLSTIKFEPVNAEMEYKNKKKIFTIPYVIEMNQNGILDREYFTLPKDKFLFLTMYDFQSVSERKNPTATLQAYKKAFLNNDDVGIIIKINHLKNKKELVKLKKELKEYKNIYIITNNLTRREIESLISIADVLISLHRSEGFGLPLAEAMYLGTPVIATNWSANTEFMSSECACLVDFNLIDIEKNIGPYKKGNQWADADILQASEYMQKLFVDQKYYHDKAVNGKSYIRDILSYDRVSGIVEQRTEEIWNRIS